MGANVSQAKGIVLRSAAETGRIDEVKQLIESGVNPNAVDGVCCVTVLTDTLCVSCIVYSGCFGCGCSVIELCACVVQ